MSDSGITTIAELLKKKGVVSSQVAMINFRVGKVVFEEVSAKGESVINELSQSLLSKGLGIYPDFLYEAMRVFKHIKSEETLYAIRNKIGSHRFSWGFLVNHCTRIPLGDTEEARAYWSRTIQEAESGFLKAEGAMDKIGRFFSSIPDEVKDQAESLYSLIRPVMDGPMTFLHTADIQACESFLTAGKEIIDPETGKNERLLDMHRCLSFVVDTAIRSGCRAAFIPGDVTENAVSTPNEQGFLLASLLRLAERMPVFVEPGNHGLSNKPKDASALEFLKGRKNIYVVEKPGVFYLEGQQVSAKPSPQWPQRDCAKVFVLPFPSKGIVSSDAIDKTVEELNRLASRKLRLQLDIFRSEIDPVVPNILLAHITVAGARGATNDVMIKYDPALLPEDFRGFDYVALGHIHEYQQAAPNAWYSSSIDRQDFNEEESPRGFIIVTFEGKTPSVEFVETPARKFQTLSPAFFDDPQWKEKVEPKTIYRVKGEVTKEDYDRLKPLILEFPVPIQNKLTKRRALQLQSSRITDDLSEEEALKRHLEDKGHTPEFVTECLRTHHEIVTGAKKDPGALKKAA